MHRCGVRVARINVEDSIFKDIRFFELAQTLGGIDAALGSIVRAWIVAQGYWLTNGVGIPYTVWEKQKLRPELIEVGLAEVRGDFVYVIGSKEQFAWLNAASEKGKVGGPAAAKARVENIKESKRLVSSDNDTDRLSTSSSSSSSSSSFSNSKTKEENFVKIETSEPIEGITEAVGVWKQTLKSFGKLRELNPSEQTQIARAIQRYGYDYVSRALLGAKNEPKSEKYNPKDHVSLQRTLDPQKIEKFVNWGTAAFNSQNIEKLRIDKDEEIDFSYDELKDNAQRVRQLIAEIGK